MVLEGILELVYGTPYVLVCVSIILCLPDFTLFAGHLCLGQHSCGPEQPVPPLPPSSHGKGVLLVGVVGVDEVAPLGDALDEGGQGEQALQHRVEVARVPC